ncbi:MAG: hypothetical protein ACLUFN_08640 [Eubacterium sp.]
MKKYLSLVLSIIFLAVMFCGCSSNGEDNSNNQADIKYTYDSAYSGFDESTIRAYESVCEAVINGTEELRINIGMLDNVKQLIYTSFPLYCLISDITVNSDNSGIIIKYTQDTDAHLKSVSDFSSRIADIQNACGIGTVSDSEYVVNVYNYVASNIKESSEASITSYDAIMNIGGNSYTYSNMFEYILQQSDIPAYHIIAIDSEQGAKGLSAAEINDNLYFFDVMSEYKDNAGKQLVYFGMTTDDVGTEGLTSLMLSNQQTAPDASDLTFDACRMCTSWELKDGSLLITRNDGETVKIEIE